MNITIINGSPKGELSVTLNFSRLLEKQFKEHTFTRVNAGKDINGLEKNRQMFDETLEVLKKSDLIIWSFPVYFLSVPSQLMRFVDLLNVNDAKNILIGKYATSLSTSGHYFDHTAHEYIHGISEDLGMKCFDGFSADAGYFLKEEKRKEFVSYFKTLFTRIERKQPVLKRFSPVQESDNFVFSPPPVMIKTAGDLKTIIIADLTKSDKNLASMVDVYKNKSATTTEVVNIYNADIKGGCLGCCRCLLEGSCVYKDDYRNLFDNITQNADIIIFAGTIKNRFLSSRWKQFFDRSFYCGHKPVLEGKAIGFMLSGSLTRNSVLREFLNGYTQAVTGSSLMEIVTDECSDEQQLTDQIKIFAENLMENSREKISKPLDYLGVGGSKIFRDLVYSLRWFFTEDHKYFKSSGKYDFPNSNLSVNIRSLIMGVLMSLPGAKSKMAKNINKKILEPYENILRNLT
jgi:multimeric flavodoxin WrbA